MEVFIHGGENTQYLETQIYAINEFLPVDTIYYVQGPLAASPGAASSSKYHEAEDLPSELEIINLTRNEVERVAKSVRLRQTIIYLVEHHQTTEHALYLHGDCIPYSPMTVEEILQGMECAGHHMFSLQWYLTNKENPNHTQAILEKKIQLYGSPNVSTSGWSSMVNDGYEEQLPYYRIQNMLPGFLHLDDYRLDFQHTIQNKLTAIRRILGLE